MDLANFRDLVMDLHKSDKDIEDVLYEVVVLDVDEIYEFCSILETHRPKVYKRFENSIRRKGN